ncbi:histidine kinase-, DNA gyrase B-, and HSP90-like ATPase family protein, partial [Tanacetum coccineum]
NQSGSRIYRDIVNSGKRWVIKVKEIGLASDFVAEDEGNGNGEESAKKIIECIRREEFGLDPNISAIEEDGILKKLNTRLGSGLHRLSQDLYSQDSNFLLELVQNADDNAYPCDVEPTLTFVLPRTAVIVLTNDQGFSVEAIKALCKDSSLSKKESSAGYIGKKGIGFKSVFQVTDAPEIHSNGFHVKFDIIDGPIDFVLPKIVPLFDVDLFCKLVSRDNDPTDEICWKTCIMLPFRSKEGEGFPVEDDLNSMFSSFHPSLLLFLHRLKCIKFRNTLNDSLIVMRKQVVKDGIVHIFLGKENFTWFVKSGTLQACHIRHDVQTTEISVALMLENLGNGNDIPKLKRQPDFALFPFRSYGLKFIIRADFVASSSREEVNPELLNGHVENITQMLYKIGVQQLSTHDALKVHILPAVCDEKVIAESTELMIEYLSLIMFHLESSCCSECLVEKKHILSQLRNKGFNSTNHGFKRLVDVPIHFSKEFGNPIDMSKLVGGTDMKWFEIDISYLKHP